jgi:outer membrane protein assembly factor BamA
MRAMGASVAQLRPLALGLLLLGRTALAGSEADAGAPEGADVRVLPVGAPAYTPEQGFLLAAGGVMSWNGDPQHAELPRSSLTLIVGASTSGSLLLQSRLATFLLADTLRVSAEVDVRDQPDNYFGVGFSSGFTRPLGETTTALRRTWWSVEPTVLQRLRGPLFVGLVLQLSGSLARDVSAGVAADPDFQRQGPRVLNTGLGLTVRYDSRDVPVNAWEGLLLAATLTGYAPVLGGTSSWSSLGLDYRQYVQVARPGSTLAWQVKYRSAFGDAPWSELSLVGTPWDLRAYRWGQYRDRTALTAVVEYRFMLPFPPESLWSHLGFAGWLGVGALGPQAWPDLSHVLPAAGAGLRVELLRRITFRLDVGFGREARAVYFNFLEAF